MREGGFGGGTKREDYGTVRYLSGWRLNERLRWQRETRFGGRLDEATVGEEGKETDRERAVFIAEERGGTGEPRGDCRAAAVGRLGGGGMFFPATHRTALSAGVGRWMRGARRTQWKSGRSALRWRAIPLWAPREIAHVLSTIDVCIKNRGSGLCLSVILLGGWDRRDQDALARHPPPRQKDDSPAAPACSANLRYLHTR